MEAMDCGKLAMCGGSGERRFIGKVTQAERDEIQALHERRNGLTELVRALAEADDDLLKNTHFYEKIVADLGSTMTRHQKWWDDRAKQYCWENPGGLGWEIEFETCRIFRK